LNGWTAAVKKAVKKEKALTIDTNQSINQSTETQNDPSINQSINQLKHKMTHQSINQSIVLRNSPVLATNLSSSSICSRSSFFSTGGSYNGRASERTRVSDWMTRSASGMFEEL
jgi:hypothetical protein